MATKRTTKKEESRSRPSEIGANETRVTSQSDCLNRIASKRHSLTGKDKEIASYILNHQSEFVKLTIYELSAQVGVSTASITRFARRMGHKGYNDLRIAMAHSLGARGPEPFQLNADGSTPESKIEMVFQQNIVSLRETLRSISKENLIRAADACSRANKVYFYGVGASGLVAQDAAGWMALLGIQAEAFSDPYRQLASCVHLGKGDVAWGVSHTGTSRPVIDSLRIARESGASTICTTNYSDAPLVELADIALVTRSSEKHIHVAALSSRIAQLCVFDAVYTLMSASLTGKIVKRLSRLEDYVIDILRKS
ncbi:MAG: MurR/RpiR family transcriptional regulator [Acidobacteriota bacterium]